MWSFVTHRLRPPFARIMSKHRFASGLPARKDQPRPAEGPKKSSSERLQKVLAAAGLGSRRKCEELILEGRVDVDGKTVTELGTKVDPERQKIIVDGEALPQTEREYYLVYKPSGVVTTNYDQAGRPRVVDLIPDSDGLFAIGRLDLYSEGMILITNDGALTNRLAHPRYGVEKTYHAIVAGMPEAETLEQLRKGVHLAEGYAHVKKIQVKAKSKQSTLLEIVLDEGRNREIRRLLARVDHKVLKLKRIAIGPLEMGEMNPGEYRKLTPEEVQMLYNLAPAEPLAAGSKPGRPRKKVFSPRGGTTSRGAARPKGGSREMRSARGSSEKRPVEKLAAEKRPTDKRFADKRPISKRPADKRSVDKRSTVGETRSVRRQPKPIKRIRRELPE